MRRKLFTTAMSTALCLSLAMPLMTACGNSASDKAETQETVQAVETADTAEAAEAVNETGAAEAAEAAETAVAAETTDAAATTAAAETADAAETAAAAETDENYVIELDPQYNVPTDELLKSFPITYQTPAETELSQKIQNRMLNGFNRWNMGYDAWEHWGEVLYHDDSIYNVHGVRFTLEEYQKSMDASLKSMDIQMGNFNNMILSDDWMAIRYDITNINRETGEANPGTTMEFAKFGDYGELGAKVDEGWGGVKGRDYDPMLNFLTDEEKAAQEKFMEEMIAKELPETDNLEEKYPVLYPTTIDTEIGGKMKVAILNEFEQWNSGYDAWAAYVDTMYDANIEYDLSDEKMDLEGFKAAMKDKVDNTKRVQINNILVSKDWAAIHFWDVTTDEAGEKTANNHMQFLHFVEDGDNVKVDMCWAK